MMINATTDPGLSNPDHMMKHTYVYKEERLSSMICSWIRQCLSRAKFALNKNHFAQCRDLNCIFTELKKITKIIIIPKQFQKIFSYNYYMNIKFCDFFSFGKNYFKVNALR